MAYLGRKAALAGLTSSDIPDNSITSAKIVDGAVALADIGNDAVGTAELANDVVISTSGAITTTGAFTSIGIDDNADANAMTIDSSENATFEKDVTVGNGSAGATVLKVLGGEAGTAEVNLFPDQADDNPDKWKIVGKTDSSFQISTYNSGAYLPAITFQPDSSVNGAHTILGEFQSGRTFTNVQLQVNDVQNNAPIIALVGQAATPNAGARNWCMRSNAVAYGDLCFFVSADSTGTPVQGDAMFSISASGCIASGINASGTQRLKLEKAGHSSQEMFNQNLTWSSGTVYFERLQINGGTKGQVTSQGTNISWSDTSDYRLKENVVPMTNSISRLKNLKPVFFDWIETSQPFEGFLAHEAQEVVGIAVTGEKDAVFPEVLYTSDDELPEGKSIGDVKTPETINPQMMENSKLVPLLVGALQEAITRIEALESA